jgi:hypothetical protein
MIFDVCTSNQFSIVNRKFKDLEYSILLDQLAQYTLNYTRLLNENGTAQQKEQCQQTIRGLLAEINIREIESDRGSDRSKDSSNEIIR